MNAQTPPEADDREPERKQLRGSTLLMAGRGISILINFGVQVLTVRYLSKLDYGAFAYGLAIVLLVSKTSLFGMNRTASRWASVYYEQRDYAKFFGSMALIFGTVGTIGLSVVLAVLGFRGWIGDHVVSDPLSLTLLLTLIVLAPVEAVDRVLQAYFAVFSRPRLVFFRRHIVGPTLKLAAVLIVMAAGGNARMLAWAYVGGGLIGLAIGLSLLLRLLREQSLTTALRTTKLAFPVRRILSFGAGMLHSELAVVLRNALAVVLLEYFHDPSHVAAFRAVLPVARLNHLVFESFALMFMPAAARLITRSGTRSVERLHWRTMSWITLLSFPIFIVTFTLADPITGLLFGERYADSGPVLAVMSLGYFVFAALGLSHLTLKASGRLRLIVATDLIAIVLTVALELLLIPRFGPMGAAAAVAIVIIVHILIIQVALAVQGEFRLFPREHLTVFALAVSSGLALMWLVRSGVAPAWAALALGAAVWVVLVLLMRRRLDVGDSFPEILRLPLVGRLFASRGPSDEGPGSDATR